MTYSIVARDGRTGRLGVAVQSHYLGVGRVVPWAEPGVGAVATQAAANPRLGPISLELLRNGRTPAEVVSAIVALDDEPDIRQLGVVDAHGAAAAHTGLRCLPEAGHAVGHGYAVQGNILARSTCWPAMAAAYERAQAAGLEFSACLLTCLDAAEAEGGDLRGRQSAAILIVEGSSRIARWPRAILDVSIIDHPDPVGELRRLVNLIESHDLLDDDGDAARRGQSRMDRYREVRRRAPDLPQLAFNMGVEFANAGDVDAAYREIAIALASGERWKMTLDRYVQAGRFTNQAVLSELLTRLGRKGAIG